MRRVAPLLMSPLLLCCHYPTSHMSRSPQVLSEGLRARVIWRNAASSTEHDLAPSEKLPPGAQVQLRISSVAPGVSVHAFMYQPPEAKLLGNCDQQPSGAMTEEVCFSVPAPHPSDARYGSLVTQTLMVVASQGTPDAALCTLLSAPCHAGSQRSAEAGKDEPPPKIEDKPNRARTLVFQVGTSEGSVKTAALIVPVRLDYAP